MGPLACASDPTNSKSRFSCSFALWCAPYASSLRTAVTCLCLPIYPACLPPCFPQSNPTRASPSPFPSVREAEVAHRRTDVKSRGKGKCTVRLAKSISYMIAIVRRRFFRHKRVYSHRDGTGAVPFACESFPPKQRPPRHGLNPEYDHRETILAWPPRQIEN